MTKPKHTVRPLTKRDRLLILKRQNRKPTGYVIFRGPSRIDGAPIVVIAITNSNNRKTGNMVQTYILRADMPPIDAVRTGADYSICGNCRHRGTNGKNRTCYVNLGQGPRAVYDAWQRGLYRAVDYGTAALIGENKLVRLGTYGDPAAPPLRTWLWLTALANGHTGYTHAWRTFPDLKELCMASADTIAEAWEAQAKGWRTFRVSMKQADAERSARLNESRCPASAEAGRLLTCSQCKACNGKATGRHGNITIQAHGGTAVMSAVKALQTAAPRFNLQKT